jgi:dTDP-4-amino-4,6-dideoxygalactose transaminase
MHLQPLFAGCEVHGGGVAEDLFERGLCLPSGSNLTLSDLSRVVDGVQCCQTSR